MENIVKALRFPWFMKNIEPSVDWCGGYAGFLTVYHNFLVLLLHFVTRTINSVYGMMPPKNFSILNLGVFECIGILSYFLASALAPILF